MNQSSSTSGPCDGVICYAGVDWWYHNRGHSECQIMRRLAAQTPVLWVNSLGMRAPSPGKSDLMIRRYLRKARSTLKGLRRDESGMWVYSPIFVPKYTNRIMALNGAIVSRQVAFFAKRLGITRPSVFATVPTAAPAVEAAQSHWVRRVFNRSDDFSQFPEADVDFVRHFEQRMFDAVDTTLYVNRVLYERERDTAPDPIFIGHGVEFEHFDRPRLPRDEIPAEIAALPRPIVGFYGGLDDYTIDLELMIECARAVAPGTLLVIGPKVMDIAALEGEPNVVYLGPIAYEKLPAYACQFDVGIMPWLDNEWIRGCNPIKLKEYLALGFPTVTTDFDQLREYRHLVYPALGHEQFLQQLRRALAEANDDLVRQRKDTVRQDGWDRITARVGELLRVSPAQETPAQEANARCAV